MTEFLAKYMIKEQNQIELSRQYSPTLPAARASEEKLGAREVVVDLHQIEGTSEIEERKQGSHEGSRSLRPRGEHSHSQSSAERLKYRSRSRSYSPTEKRPPARVSHQTYEDSLITYLVLSGLDHNISETQIINAIAPHIRVYVSIHRLL